MIWSPDARIWEPGRRPPPRVILPGRDGAAQQAMPSAIINHRLPLKPQGVAGNGFLNDLTAYWKLDDAANGTRSDATGRGNTLSDINSNVGSAAGKIGNAAVFTGTGGSLTGLDIAHNADVALDGGDWSISAWVNLASKSYYGVVWFAGSGTDYSTGLYYNLVLDAFVYQFKQDASINLSPANALAVGAWMHHVVTWNSATKTALPYQNGTPAAGGGYTYSTAMSGTSLPFYVGCKSTTNRFDGTIDEVGIWHRKLSGADVTALYNAGAGLAYSAFTS